MFNSNKNDDQYSLQIMILELLPASEKSVLGDPYRSLQFFHRQYSIQHLQLVRKLRNNIISNIVSKIAYQNSLEFSSKIRHLVKITCSRIFVSKF